MQDFLGIDIERKQDGRIHLTQPHLIEQIIKELRVDHEAIKGKKIPASSSKILWRHTESEKFDGHFNYRSIIGKINYLERGTRSDISYITHQCARYTADPRKEHGEALKWLGRYLKETKDKGTILKPNKEKDLVVYVDASFSGDWVQQDSSNTDTTRSRYGYII